MIARVRQHSASPRLPLSGISSRKLGKADRRYRTGQLKCRQGFARGKQHEKPGQDANFFLLIHCVSGPQLALSLVGTSRRPHYMQITAKVDGAS